MVEISGLDGFGLFCGHMVGDYVLQNDWMSSNKTNPHPGPEQYSGTIEVGAWHTRNKLWKKGHDACTIHCLLYTAAIALFAWSWMPWWGYLIVGFVHWPVDRFRLAVWWMNNVSSQKFFASKEHPMWPNGIILVDNTFHLVTLYFVALAALRWG